MLTVDTPHWVIERVTAQYFNEYGIGVWRTHHVTIRHCRALRNGAGGIEGQETKDLLIEWNETAYNGADGGPGWSSGIHLWHPQGPTHVVRHNLSHHNWDPSDHKTDGNGIAVDRGRDVGGAEIFGNVAYLNGGRGIDITESANVWVHHNTLHANSRDPAMDTQGELSVDQPVSAKGLRIWDNVFSATGKNAPLAFWPGIPHQGTSADYNLYFSELARNAAVSIIADASRPIASAKTLSLEEWQRLTSGDAHSVSADPLFRSISDADFTPKTGSAALRKGSGKDEPEFDLRGRKRTGNAVIGALELTAP